MKKGKSVGRDELRRSYKRADFPSGFVRGKYAMRIALSDHMVRLRPEIAAAFPTSEAVNAALAQVLRRMKSGRTSASSATGSKSREK